MKFAKIFAVASLMLATLLPAKADQIDLYGGKETRLLGTVGQQAKSTTATNATTDTAGMTGVCKVFVYAICDNPAGTVAFTILTSADTTNWNTLTNAFLSVPTTYTNVNAYYAAPLTNTFTNLLHGTAVTTPVASTSGFATPYISPSGYTNTATNTITSSGQAEFGFIINDANRYFAIKTVTGSSGTNYGWGGIIEGTKLR